MLGSSANDNGAGQGGIGALGEPSHPSPHAGVADRRPLSITGMHEVVALTMSTLGGGHASNNGDFLGVVGKQGKVLGELHTVRFRLDGLCWPACFRAWLRIKSIDVGHAASHVKVDDVAGFWGMIQRPIES